MTMMKAIIFAVCICILGTNGVSHDLNLPMWFWFVTTVPCFVYCVWDYFTEVKT